MLPKMNAAYHAWEAGRVVRARDLLDRQRPVGSSMSDLRGFDWRYLWTVTRPSELFTLTNATSWGYALSNDGKTLVGLVGNSGDTNLDWRLQFWNLPERRRVAELKTDTSWIFNAAFSPDGHTFAMSRFGGTGTNSFLQLWDAEARRLVKELPFERPLLGVAFSPDGRILAASGGNMYVTSSSGEVRFWDAATGTLFRPALRMPQWAYQVAFSPYGRNWPFRAVTAWPAYSKFPPETPWPN
jgi:WD40 repeat protein